MKNNQETKAAILEQVDGGVTPAAMFAMGMLSDVQQLIAMGQYQTAIQALNDAKVVINERLATKDEHGRHDFNEVEKKTNTFIAKVLAKRG